MSSKWKLACSAVMIAVVVSLAATHPQQLRGFLTTLRGLSLVSLATALVLVLAQVSAQALRLRAIVPRGTPVSIVRAGYIFALGDWTNIFTPARGGDALKIVLLSRSQPPGRCSLARATGVLLADKLVDYGTLVAICGMTGLLQVLLTRTQARLPSLTLSAAVAVGLVLLLLAIRAWAPGLFAATRPRVRELAGGLSGLADPVRCATSVSFSVVARLAEAMALGVLCLALGGPPASLSQRLLAILILNVGTMVPLSVASVGLYEASLAYGLTLSGVPWTVALTAAATHHAVQLLGISLSAAGYALATRRRPAPWIAGRAEPSRESTTDPLPSAQAEEAAPGA